MVEDGGQIPKPNSVNSSGELMKHLDANHYLLAHDQIDTSRMALGTWRLAG
jgi:hypothetical protein